MGHARLDGGIVILLASMAWESYFEYLELDSRLMWIVWLEQNRRSLENTEKMLEELNVLCQRSLFDWFHCWGFTDCSSLSEFMFSLRIAFWFLSLCCMFFPLLVVHHHEQLVFFLTIFFNNIFLITNQIFFLSPISSSSKGICFFLNNGMEGES